MVGDMPRVKTSLTFDELSMPIFRARAAAAGMDVSRWIERAGLRKAANEDPDTIDALYANLSREERAAIVALEALDRAGPAE
jgi:hypothetical protein